jgi:hypothetical protein
MHLACYYLQQNDSKQMSSIFFFLGVCELVEMNMIVLVIVVNLKKIENFVNAFF